MITLTDTEWMNLINPTRELGPCCGNIDNLRGWIADTASLGGDITPEYAEDVLEAYNIAAKDHELEDKPTLQKFIRQVREAAQ